MTEEKYEHISDLPDYKELLLQEKSQEISARDLILKVILFIFALGNLACLSLYFFNGFGLTHLTDAAMHSLAAATIAEVTGLLIILIKFYFSK